MPPAIILTRLLTSSSPGHDPLVPCPLSLVPCPLSTCPLVSAVGDLHSTPYTQQRNGNATLLAGQPLRLIKCAEWQKHEPARAVRLVSKKLSPDFSS